MVKPQLVWMLDGQTNWGTHTVIQLYITHWIYSGQRSLKLCQKSPQLFHFLEEAKAIPYPCSVMLQHAPFKLGKLLENKLADLPTPKYFCQYSGQPICVLPDFFADAPPISQNKTVSKVDFTIYHSSCKNSVWTHIFNYIDPLHSDDLFCLPLPKSFSIKD